jgi:hypothetical protein
MNLTPPYRAFLEQLDALMVEARRLGLYRTTEGVHRALDTARSEVYEAIPPPTPAPSVHVDFSVGPIREQSPPTRRT